MKRPQGRILLASLENSLEEIVGAREERSKKQVSRSTGWWVRLEKNLREPCEDLDFFPIMGTMAGSFLFLMYIYLSGCTRTFSYSM